MALDVYPKHWSIIPPAAAKPIYGHPLCPRHGYLFGGQTIDIVRGERGTINGTQGTAVWSAASVRGYAGKSREHSNILDFDQIGLDTVILPTGEATFVLGYQKTDGTNRDSVAFAVTGGVTGNVCTFYCPFSDGVTYWDYGGEGGANRISVGGLTFGDDIWCLTIGPRGSEIWQNGIRRVNNASNVTRTQSNTQFQLGKAAVSAPHNGDLVRWKFLWIYHRQIRENEITEVTRNPFCWVDPRP